MDIKKAVSQVGETAPGYRLFCMCRSFKSAA